MTTSSKLGASAAVTLFAWLVLVLANALVGLIGLVELVIVACLWIGGLFLIWRR